MHVNACSEMYWAFWKRTCLYQIAITPKCFHACAHIHVHPRCVPVVQKLAGRLLCASELCAVHPLRYHPRDSHACTGKSLSVLPETYHSQAMTLRQQHSPPSSTLHASKIRTSPVHCLRAGVLRARNQGLDSYHSSPAGDGATIL